MALHNTASTVEFETTNFYCCYELNVHRGGKQGGPISFVWLGGIEIEGKWARCVIPSTEAFLHICVSMQFNYSLSSRSLVF